MTVQDYLEARLAALKEPVVNIGQDNTAIEEAIYAKLMSKKFRKLKPGQLCIDVVKRGVARAIENKTPIVLSLCFGGNKLWRFEEAPDIDWAELFTLLYYIDYAKTVAAVHVPGVRLDFYSMDIFVEGLDNLSRVETDAYSNGFRAMIEWLKPLMPKGVTVTYRRHGEMYNSPEDHQTELEAAKKIILAEHDGHLPVLSDEQGTRTELNVRLNPGQANDPQWREKVELEHRAVFKTKTLNEYFTDPDMIFVCPNYFEDSIVIGSTKRSMAKFWAAVGVLERSSDGYNEIVLTPKQLEHANFTWEDVSIDGLNGKNFKKIRVIELSTAKGQQ